MQTVTEGLKRWHNGSLLRNIIARDFFYATYLLAMHISQQIKVMLPTRQRHIERQATFLE
jgi:hypothetical protein